MNWRPTDKRHQGSGRGAPIDRLEQAKRAKAQLLNSLAELRAKTAVPAEPAPTIVADETVRDRAAHLLALSSLPLWRLGDTTSLKVSEPYSELADVVLQSMEANDRRAVLCWPNCTASPSALAVLLALADGAAAPKLRIGDIDALSAPIGLRALIFPYSQTARRSIRQIYADKAYVGQMNLLHQVRSTKPGEDEALADFHKVLARSNKLTGLALDGKIYDEFRHPCLDELMPFGPCQGANGRVGLLWRVRTKTDLKHISRSGSADDPSKARYFLFGLKANDAIVPSLRALDRKVDVIFLDLSSTGRTRLGRDWLVRTKEFLDQVDNQVGPVATIAFTDDPWVLDTLRFDGLLRKPTRKVKSPALSRVVFAARPDIVSTRSVHVPSYSVVKRQEVTGFSGEVEGLLQALRLSAKGAEEFGDREATDLLRNLIGTIRRCSSLPASRAKFSEYLEKVVGSFGAADLQVAYRVAGQLRQLRSSVGPWAQMTGKDCNILLDQVERVWENTDELTPMAPMLRDTIKSYLGKSSSTVVLFQKDMLADFAAHTLSHDDEIGFAVQTRLEKEMFFFLDDHGLDDLAQLPGPRRNYIKTVIVVAPKRSQILELLAREWLPENLVVLGDSDTLRSSAADARRLASHKELSAIAPRLNSFAEKAEGLVYRPIFSKEVNQFHEDVEFPTSSIVNLAGHIKADQTAIRLRLSGDQLLLARPATKLILQDTNRTVPTFLECAAKDVDVGDRVCIISDAFLDMARPMLNISVRAAEEIRDYHELVLERFAGLPGNTTNQKLAYIVSSMALPEVSVQRAHYWVDLESQKLVELHEVVPHAPRERQTFLAFMKALSVTDAKSQHYWTWAVIAQRSSRLRAAINFHEAYRTILVDNYAAQSSDPERSSEIRRLKVAAEDFVGVVEEKTTQRGEHATA